MDNLSIDTGTTQAAEQSLRGVTSELRTQQQLLKQNAELAAQLQRDVRGPRGSRGPGRAARGDEDLGAQLAADIESSHNDALGAKLARDISSAEKKQNFEKAFDETLKKRLEGWKARFAPAAVTSGERDISARRLGGGPNELLALLKGDVSVRGIKGLSNVAGFGAQEIGLKGLSGGAFALADILGPLAAGGAAAAGLVALIKEAVLPNFEERIAQGNERMNAFRRSFSGDPGLDQRRNESTLSFRDERTGFGFFEDEVTGTTVSQEEGRTRKMTERLAQDIRFNAKPTFMHNNTFAENIENRSKVIAEFASNNELLQKNPFLASVFLNRQFAGGIDTAGATAHLNFGANDNFGMVLGDLLEHGANGAIVAQKVRGAAAAALRAQQLDVEERTAMEHDPARMVAYRNSERIQRASEEFHMMQHMQWNEN